ncbi:YqiJ family protein [Moraxella oblonga]|uniref:YqiJ family protein n=1 Tax=Moraxella oblonga TaxID=200413 RepID=UPI00082AED54|nr:YqiJ family protein [Moraxella oblonga]
MTALWQLLNAPQTAPFGIALMLMFLLFVVEVLAMLVGGANDWLDNLLPDELSEVNAHSEIGIDTVDSGAFIRFLSWLYFGKVPVLMLFVLFLAIFGLLGFIVQNIIFNIAGFYLPVFVAIILVWMLSLPILRLSAKGLYKILPKDETTAINQNELIGRIGTITIGIANQDKKAEVKVKDKYGQMHYVMAFCDNDDILTQGDTVLLVAQKGNDFLAIKNVNGVLVD